MVTRTLRKDMVARRIGGGYNIYDGAGILRYVVIHDGTIFRNVQAGGRKFYKPEHLQRLPGYQVLVMKEVFGAISRLRAKEDALNLANLV